MSLDSLTVINPKTRTEFRRWLKTSHERKDSIWVVLYKKSAGPGFLSYADIVDESLCFGWIDSRPRKRDDKTFLILISPRREKSVWSAVNKAKIRQLIRSKKMTVHGMKKIKQAKENGSWNTLEKSDRLQLPAELIQKFKANKPSKLKFDAFSPSSKKALLVWIYASKTEVTRQKRIEKTVKMAALGQKANLVRAKPKP